jgi:hypothetical protein
MYGNLAYGENILALRLVSKLPDLRAGYANPIVRSAHEMGSRRVSKKEQATQSVACSFLVTRTGRRRWRLSKHLAASRQMGKMHIRHQIFSCSEHLAGFASAKQITKTKKEHSASVPFLFW